MKQHLSNAVIDRIPVKMHLHSMWEGNDLEGNAEETERYDWLEQHAPGMFVLIDTGDYIVPECCEEWGRLHVEHHEHCETYDAQYSLYLVPMHVWNACSEAVLAADREWREKHNRCQIQEKTQVSYIPLVPQFVSDQILPEKEA